MDKNKEEENKIINTYLGIPYINAGRNKRAFDCWGLILDIFKNRNINLFDLADEETYSKLWVLDGDKNYLEKYKTKIDWEEVEVPKFLDIIIFKNCRNIPNHAGVYLSGNRFIHCKDGAGVVINSINKSYKARIFKIYRIKGR